LFGVDFGVIARKAGIFEDGARRLAGGEFLYALANNSNLAIGCVQPFSLAETNSPISF